MSWRREEDEDTRTRADWRVSALGSLSRSLVAVFSVRIFCSVLFGWWTKK